MAEKPNPTAAERKKKAWVKKNENVNIGMLIVCSNFLLLNRYIVKDSYELFSI